MLRTRANTSMYVKNASPVGRSVLLRATSFYPEGAFLNCPMQKAALSDRMPEADEQGIG